MSYEITIEGGSSKKLLTAGKFCDRDIIVTATGGGGGNLFGHVFASGSFTIEEDNSTSYTVLTPEELFEAVKDDFPGAVRLSDSYYGKNSTASWNIPQYVMFMCWIDSTQPSYALKNNQFLGVYLTKAAAINNGTSALLYADNYRSPAGRTGATNYAQVTISTTGIAIGLSTKAMMYAGNKYNWMLTVIDHGEKQP